MSEYQDLIGWFYHRINIPSCGCELIAYGGEVIGRLDDHHYLLDRGPGEWGCFVASIRELANGSRWRFYPTVENFAESVKYGSLSDFMSYHREHADSPFPSFA